MLKSYEQPPKLEKNEEKKNYVFEKFHNVDFRIESFPEIFERVVELANMPESHFDDAVKMSEIIEFLWEDFEKEAEFDFSKEELKLACLFHDIGKSGPVEANREQRMMIEQIFNPVFFNIHSDKFNNSTEFKNKSNAEKSNLMKSLPIKRILEIENFPNNEEILEYLETLQLHIYNEQTKSIQIEKLDPAKHSMITLWREHDVWTWQILNKYGGQDISEELKIVSSTHHTLEGHDPASLGGEVPDEAVALETIDKYSIITLVDKYQAFIDRSDIDHDKAIQLLESIIKESKAKKIINHGDTLFNQFMKYLRILEKHPEIADKII